MISKLVCIKDFSFFEKGKLYYYWTNFEGLNHIVSREPYPKGKSWAFDGPPTEKNKDREYIFDYFMTIDDWRNKQIDVITSNK